MQSVYHVHTSHRTGYTFEKPNVIHLNTNGEYVINEYDITTPVTQTNTHTIYKAYIPEDSRGDRTESYVKYFCNDVDAFDYQEAMKNHRTSKMICSCVIDVFNVYDTIAEIPVVMKPISASNLTYQKMKQTDYRFDSSLTTDDKLKILEMERSTQPI